MASRYPTLRQLMEELKAEALIDLLEQVEDPRRGNRTQHPLVNVLFIALCAILAGFESFREMELFARQRQEWFEQFLDLSMGIPSHDTFTRVLSMLDPQAVFEVLQEWTAQWAQRVDGEQIAIDGKAMRRALKQGKGNALTHIVSAWACKAGQVVGMRAQRKYGSEKASAEQLVALLNLNGALVSMDAGLGYQDMAQRIVDKKGAYLFAVKANHPKLFDEIEACTRRVLEQHDPAAATHNAPPQPTGDGEVYVATERSHGRRVQWRCVVVPVRNTANAATWPQATAVAMVERMCQCGHGQRTVGTRYYITSLQAPRPDAVLAAVRRHWRVENQLHWTLDVTFGEDACQARAANAAAVVGALRRAAFNLLRQAKTRDVSMRALRGMAAMSPEAMLQILMGRTPSIKPRKVR